MKAARIHEFGSPGVIVIEDVPRPEPGPGEVLVRVAAAGVGPWDAWIRAHTSEVSASLPLTLGSDLSGVVEAVGPGVSGLAAGDEVYGATNPDFCGAYAEYAIARATMLARKPRVLTDIQAASVPVVAVTAWQMLFDYAEAKLGQTVLVHGGAGNVGAYAVQLAREAGLHVTATARARDIEYVRGLGAARVLNFETTELEKEVADLDVAIDTVGGDTLARSVAVLKPGGILVSAVSPFPDPKPAAIRTAFFLVDVTTARLDALTDLFERGKLVTQVGTVLGLDRARHAHEMLGGAPHERGKIVLEVRGPLSAAESAP